MSEEPVSALVERIKRCWARVRIAVLTLFICYQVVGLGLYLTPPCRFRDMLLTPFRSYIDAAAMWQEFCLFTPDPDFHNDLVVARVTFESGRSIMWIPPRTDNAGPLQKLYNERWRKWAIEGVNSENYKHIWPDAARYIARACCVPDMAKPTSVELIRLRELIPKPEDRHAPIRKTVTSLFTYQVQPRDLL